jgi:hypothetical protein
MDGSQPGNDIDTQMMRERGADVEALAQSIVDIELEALTLQHHLSVARPMPRPHKQRWWRRSA